LEEFSVDLFLKIVIYNEELGKPSNLRGYKARFHDEAKNDTYIKYLESLVKPISSLTQRDCIIIFDINNFISASCEFWHFIDHEFFLEMMRFKKRKLVEDP
jgi:hypothetical protein